jgi:nicotinamide mononucleotide (NMN) deamidase PncC
MLDNDTATMFHHNVAKLLFMCKRARPDIQTAIAFLCTRVKGPDNKDYKKLGQVMRYLQGTTKM